MPIFDLVIDPEDYVFSCRTPDIKELIDTLIKHKHLPQLAVQTTPYQYGIAEMEFEAALSSLHGKWNNLTSEEEKLILDLAKKV